jgi:thymidylate synthase (FAD)
MSAKLTYITPLWIIAKGIRYSHNNHDKSDTEQIGKDNTIGKKDFDLIKRVGFKYKHESVLEHSLLVFDIECSRALLQELSRHRLQSLTVKSTRYTLKELKDEKCFSRWDPDTREFIMELDAYYRANNYVIFTDNEEVDNRIIYALEELRWLISEEKLSNDIAKYSLPECFKTSLQLSLNLRSLLNLLRLRLSKDALWEFRQLAYDMVNSLPDDYKELVLSDDGVSKLYKEFK